MIFINHRTACGSVLSILICISFLLHLHAFSSTKLLNRQCNRRMCPLNAAQDKSEQLYDDDDCADLCDSYETTTVTHVQQQQQQPVKKSIFKSRPHKKRLRPPPWSDPKPTVCHSCHGRGDLICRFCEETGYLSSIGSSCNIVFYAGFGENCPVCDDGMESCHDCAGTGYVFSWDTKKNV